jgi:hypothetical protein
VRVGRWQLVVHGRWLGLGVGVWPPTGPNRAVMFDRRIRLGFVQLHRWTYDFPHHGEPTIKVARGA